jgi:hypothetical protein
VSIEIRDIDDKDFALRRMKEMHGVDLTVEQFRELVTDWLQLLSGPMAAVADADSRASSPWAVDIGTGEVTEQFTPEQEQARERLRRIAKETLHTLLNRYRAGV